VGSIRGGVDTSGKSSCDLGSTDCAVELNILNLIMLNPVGDKSRIYVQLSANRAAEGLLPHSSRHQHDVAMRAI
jgi:hypothetical protein